MSILPSYSVTHDNGSKRSVWQGLCVLLIAGFVTMFDLFVVNVAIPSIRIELNASFTQISFIIVSYQLGFGVLLITGGRLGDRYGRRRLFIIGMMGFTLASACCGFAPDIWLLIAARMLQGMTAALLFPQVYSSIRVVFNGEDRRRAFGLLGMTLGLAAISGQVLGGWLLEADIFGLDWRTIFLVNVPIGLIAIITAHCIPETQSSSRPTLDWLGNLLISISLALLLVALIEGSENKWPAWSLIALSMSTLLLVLFYKQQQKRWMSGHDPLVDMHLIMQRRFMLGIFLVLLVYSTSSSFFLCFALLVQTGLGLSPFAAGSIFAPCSVGFMFSSLAASRLVTRWGLNAIIAGSLLYTISIGVLIIQVSMSGAALKPVILIPVLTLVGAGQGMIMTPLLNLVLGFISEESSGMASGVISTMQQIGAALGVAVVGMLFHYALSNSLSLSQPEQYVFAFVSGMAYNLGAAMLISLLLFFMSWAQRVNH